jgi:DNA-binding transcriptional MerR regulator
MSVQQPQDIKEFLQRQDVQERLQKSMEFARSRATVTISRAAELFDFSESQLREWEKKGLVTTKREALAQEGRGHRQYSPDELDKLAIIKTLLEEGGFALGAIPANVNEIWEQIVHARPDFPAETRLRITQPLAARPDRHVPIDQRVVHAEKEAFWRYFTSQALRLSLLLMCEDIPDTVAGIVLPLQKNTPSAMVHEPQDLLKLVEALIRGPQRLSY